MNIDLTTLIIGLIGLNLLAFLAYIIAEITVVVRTRNEEEEVKKLSIEHLILQVERRERGEHPAEAQRPGGLLPAAAVSCRNILRAAARAFEKLPRFAVGDGLANLARSLTDVRVPAPVRKRVRRESEVAQ